MLVPFDKDTGDHFHAITRWMDMKSPHSYWYKQTVWRDINQFDDTLTLKKITNSSSGADFIYTSLYNGDLRMFLSDINLLISKGHNIMRFEGKFEFCKRGQAYGVLLCDRGLV